MNLPNQTWSHGKIYLLPNPHSNRLKFYNSIVPQIYESAFRQKKAGFKTYLLQQQQIRWALNNEIEDLSKKVNNLIKGEKYGVCQNIKTFPTGVERCTSSDVAKSEFYLNNINSALNTAYDIRASIAIKWKEHFQSADYSQGRSKPWKTWGRGITERRRREH